MSKYNVGQWVVLVVNHSVYYIGNIVYRLKENI